MLHLIDKVRLIKEIKYSETSTSQGPRKNIELSRC